MSDRDFFICPNCWSELAADAGFCRQCGVSDEMGWNDELAVDVIDVPTGFGDDNDFDYGEFIDREFPSYRSFFLGLKRFLLAVLAIVLCLALLWQSF